MAEPLKNSFGRDIPERVADMIQGVMPDFDRRAFLAQALEGYDDLELTPRARRISDALAATLPEDREEAIDIVTRSLGPESRDGELKGFDSFVYLPLVFFVADHGLDCFEKSMRAQYELTKRFTAEFSIRAFLQRDPERTLARLAEWARDEDVHVRRLVSEGTRPRLPWAPRLPGFQEDPAPVLALLETLKDDPEEYVRRSVANNLNDISKDHPELVVRVAERWWSETNEDRRKLVRHALRTLVKAGHQGALGVLGFGAGSGARVGRVTCAPARVAIGDKVRMEAEITNPSDEVARALVDFEVYFVKANGSTRAKVFKGAELELQPGSSAVARKTVSLAQHTTRKHYPGQHRDPGQHRVCVLLNGESLEGAEFELS